MVHRQNDLAKVQIYFIVVHVSEMIEADVIWQRRPFTFPLFPALFIIDVREVSSEKICSGFKSSLASKYSTRTIHTPPMFWCLG